MRKRDRSLLANGASLLVCGLLAGLVVAAAAFPAVAMGGLAAKAGADTFDSLPTDVEVLPAPQISEVYANDGKTLLALLYDENRRDVPIAEVADIMQKAIANQNKCGHLGLNIKLRMHFNSSLGLSERSPPKHTQAKINGGGINGINITCHINIKIVWAADLPCLVNQQVGKISEDLPVAIFIGIGKIGLGKSTAQTKMIPFASLRFQTQNKVAETFSVCYLAEDHAQELMPAGKMVDLIGAIILFDILIEIINWQKFHYLGKNIFS